MDEVRRDELLDLLVKFDNAPTHAKHLEAIDAIVRWVEEQTHSEIVDAAVAFERGRMGSRLRLAAAVEDAGLMAKGAGDE